VIYANRSCLWFTTGFTNVLMGGFMGAIKYIKERSASIVMILKAWLSIKDL
jgi:hypothetical protein